MKAILSNSATFLASAALFLFALVVVPRAHAAVLLAQVGSPPPEIGDLIKQALTVLTDWKTGGVFVGLVAISNFGANLLKLPFIKTVLSGRPWLLPLASSLIAAVGAFATAMTSGAGLYGSLLSAVIAALTIGLGGVGLHEVVTAVFNKDKQAERAAGAVLADAVVKGDQAALTKIQGNYAELENIAALSSEEDRARQFAEWAKSHPPDAPRALAS